MQIEHRQRQRHLFIQNCKSSEQVVRSIRSTHHLQFVTTTKNNKMQHVARISSSSGSGETRHDDYVVPTTVDEVRAYVFGNGNDTSNVGRSEHLLLLHIEHSNLREIRLHELRFDGRMTIEDVKDKLYRHTGTRPATMRLYLRGTTANNRTMTELTSRSLYECGVRTGDTLVVVDDDPHSLSAGGWLENTSLVKKYTLSEEEYNKKENTYRKFKEKMRQKDPNWSMTRALRQKQQEQKKDTLVESPDHAENQPNINVNDRVQVFPGDKRGVVMYVGKDLTGLPSGWWVGVKFDEPVGKNDGMVKGIRYFDAPSKHGGLVRPSNAIVGDFPPLGIDDDDDDDDEL